MSDSVKPHRWQPTRLPVPGILQARTLEWVAISFSNAWKGKVKVKLLSCVWLLVTLWTAAHQALCPWDFPDKSTGVGCHCLFCYYASTILFQFVIANIVWNQEAWHLRLCSFSRLLWLFTVFWGAIQILDLCVLFLWEKNWHFNSNFINSVGCFGYMHAKLL